MEVSSKEEANARLQATHIEEVASLANDIKGLKVKENFLYVHGYGWYYYFAATIIFLIRVGIIFWLCRVKLWR